MAQFTFIGAGSLGFTRGLIRDILTFPALRNSRFVLMDIHPQRLQAAHRDVTRILREGGYHGASVCATGNRVEALQGADAVIVTVLIGGTQVFRHDLEIPKKYGVDLNSGDSRGPGGIMRGLRTLPVLLELCKEMEQHCPNAYLLNYTNPMSFLCRALAGQTSIPYVGLCHSVQNTVDKVARWLHIPAEELDYFSAGLNHQAWLLRLTHKGRDVTPLLRQAILRPEVYQEDPVCCQVFRQLGYIQTEEGGQNSEYNPWFRKRSDILEQYDHATGFNPGRWGFEIEAYAQKEETWEEELRQWNEATLDLKRGKEYASAIVNALFGDHTPFCFNGNIINNGTITNLPANSCVEVPILADRQGFHPLQVGELPAHLAIVNSVNAQCDNLAVEGALEGDAQKIFYAIANDPLTAAVLSLEEARDMTRELLEKNRAYLPQFTTFEFE